MKTEDKDLLLRDLCSRLPYGVKCQCFDETTIAILTGVKSKTELYFDELDYKEFDGIIKIENVKPFLFPLLSITEEQRKELQGEHLKDGQILLGIAREIFVDKNMDKRALGISRYAQDWCHKNHFDYRGLIEKGLANDATGLNIY